MDDDNNSDLIGLGKKSPVKGYRKFFKTLFKKEKLDATKDAITINIYNIAELARVLSNIKFLKSRESYKK